MSVTITDIGTSFNLLPSKDELEIVEPPPNGITHRTVTRLRFQNFDTASHTPTFSVFESNQHLVTAERPQYRRIYIPRAIVADGEQDECGVIWVLTPTQSMIVELAADPSDTGDDQKWPSVTAHWLDQFITKATPARQAESQANAERLQGFLRDNGSS